MNHCSHWEAEPDCMDSESSEEETTTRAAPVLKHDVHVLAEKYAYLIKNATSPDENAKALLLWIFELSRKRELLKPSLNFTDGMQTKHRLLTV